MPVFVSAGVQIREIDLSLYLSNISSTSLGMVGLATKGPINEKKIITTPAEFAQVFGNVNTAFMAGYAAQQYLRVGRQLTFVRVAEKDPDSNAEEPYLAKSASVTLAENAAKATLTGTINTLVTITSSSNTLTFVPDGATPGFSVVFPLGGAASLQLSISSIVTTLNANTTFKQYFAASLSTTGSLKIERLVAGQNHQFVMSGSMMTGAMGQAGPLTGVGYGLITEKPFVTGVGIFATSASTVIIGATSRFGFELSSGGSPSELDVLVVAGTYTCDQLVSHLNLVAAGFATHLVASNFAGQLKVQVKSTSSMTTLALRTPAGTNLNPVCFGVSPVVLGTAVTATASLKVVATSPGSWGNALSVKVSNVVKTDTAVTIEAVTDALDNTTTPPVYRVSAQQLANYPVKRNSVTVNFAGVTPQSVTDDGNGVLASYVAVTNEALTPGGKALIGANAGVLDHFPVKEGSVSVTWAGGNASERPATDDAGDIVSALLADIGNINYATGAFSAVPVGGFTDGSGEMDYTYYEPIVDELMDESAVTFVGSSGGNLLNTNIVPNSVSISYTGTNSPITDNGSGILRDSTSANVGTINYVTGALTAAPTGGYTPGSVQIDYDYVVTVPSQAIPDSTPGVTAGASLTAPVVPSSISITWTGGTAGEKPATDDGAGLIVDDLANNIGTINYATGALTLTPVTPYTAGTVVASYEHEATISNEAASNTTVTLSGSGPGNLVLNFPIEPESINITWTGGAGSPATDDGAGVIVNASLAAIGTVNYATGAVTLTVPNAYVPGTARIDYNYEEIVTGEVLGENADTATGTGYQGTLLHFPVRPLTVNVTWTGAAGSPATDAAGDGVLVDDDDNVVGSVNYTTGVILVNPTTGYDPGSIVVDYSYGVVGTIDYNTGVISIQPPGSYPTSGSPTWGGYTPGSVRASYTYEKTTFDLGVFQGNQNVDNYLKLVKSPQQIVDPTTGNLKDNPAYVAGANGPINGVSPWITVVDGPTSIGNTPNPLTPELTVGNRPPLVGGTDGAPPTSNPSIYIGQDNETETTGLQIFRNPEQVDINLLAVPGISDGAVCNEVIAICVERADCFGFIDPPFRTPLTNKKLTPSDAADWRNGQGEWSESHSAFNSSYAATYYPWLQVYDSVNAVKLFTPPSGHVAGACAYSDFVSEPWFPFAGLNRGHLLSPLEAETVPNKGGLDILYSNNINPIATFKKEGINIWGQKTLQTAPTALDRIGVRRLLLYMEKVIASTARSLLFEPNDAITWQSFVNLVEPLMASIQARRGISRYLVQCDRTTNTDNLLDNSTMRGVITFTPIKALENIQLDFVVTAQGATFTETAF